MMVKKIIAMLDSDAYDEVENPSDEIDFKRILPFIVLHFSLLAVLFVSFSWWAVALCLFSYALRMFAIS